MKTAAQIRAASSWCRKAPSPVVFVPTMGALHEGHASLIRKARRVADSTASRASTASTASTASKGSVVVSIFVNPRQFGPKEDLSRYPRPFAADRALCRNERVDLLFHPSVESMYAGDHSVSVHETTLSKGFCGASRVGHFDGVCTVVAMLFQIIAPDIAIFGEKDWQQLAVIRRMVRDLRMPVKIMAHPTIRENDGLALSSRNRFLTSEDRSVAPRIYESLKARSKEASEGEFSVARLRRDLIRDLSAIPGAKVEYAEIVNESTLSPMKKIGEGGTARALVALRLGVVRLIDNMALPSPR